MGVAAVAAVAATAGVAVAAGAGYGIYRMVKSKREGGRCPWCGRGSTGSDPPTPDKGCPSRPKTAEKKDGWKKSGGVAVGDFFLRTKEEMLKFALKRSLQEQGGPPGGNRSSDRTERCNSQDGDRANLPLEEFDCPICAEVCT